jgi:hypothetical protein
MFALNPSGSGKEQPPSQFRQNLWFFGQLGLYFFLVRGAHVFFSTRAENKALLSK